MRQFVVVSALLVVLTSVVATQAGATQPATATGSFSFLSDTLTPLRSNGCNTTFTEDFAALNTGGLSGVQTGSGVLVVHCDGTIWAHGTEVCSACTIGGKTGDFTDVYTVRISGANVSGTVAIVGGSATGGLAGLHLQGTFGPGTYAYDYHFDP
jgi:hypothetical protein